MWFLYLSFILCYIRLYMINLWCISEYKITMNIFREIIVLTSLIAWWKISHRETENLKPNRLIDIKISLTILTRYYIYKYNIIYKKIYGIYPYKSTIIKLYLFPLTWDTKIYEQVSRVLDLILAQMTMQNELLPSHNAIMHFCAFKRTKKEYKNLYMSLYFMRNF